MNNNQIPQEVIEVSKTLKNKGFEAYLVGGCVRDLILNREPKDWDLTTNANPEQIIELFEDTVYENTFGTVGIKTDSEDKKLKIIEVTPYRIEGKYTDNRHPDEVKFSDNLEDDLKRRDFTINSIAYDIDKGQLVDPYKGQDDIKSKVIRTVGAPEDRFSEDSLRILRAIRFSAELGFVIDSETLKAIENKSETLGNVSRERIKDEFTKIIMSENPMIGLGMAQRVGILKHIAEPLENMVGVTQNKEAHKYNDVFEHSVRALQTAADKDLELEVRLAALFHDIGKPETKREQGGNTTFYGHDVVGAKVTRETLQDLTFSKEVIKRTSKLVRWHMFFSDTEEISLSAIRRLIRNVGKENIWDLMDLRKSDRKGMGRPKEEPYRLRKFQSMIEEVMRDPISVGMLKIDGNTLMTDLNIPAGPKIGHILHALLEEVIEDPKLNTMEYLAKKAEELYELPDSELKKLGDVAKMTAESADEAEIKKLRDKRFVK